MRIGRGRLSSPGRVLSDGQLEDVRERLVDVVMRTFVLRPMPLGTITERELSDRLEVTVEVWNHLFGECRWSRERALDYVLPLVLKCIDGAHLHQVAPEPVADQVAGREGHTMWSPEDTDKLEAERRLSALAGGEGVAIDQELITGKGDDDGRN